jgi:plastocyanin
VAAALAKVSGDDQGGRVGTAAGSPIVVRVNDQFGNPVSGAAVAFAVTAGSATLGTPDDDTGADGRAQTGFTFGATPGSITITATAAGLAGSPQTFTAESGQVLVANNQFQPANLVVPAGTTVRWAWATGATSHSVVPVGGAEPTASAVSAAPFAYQHTFNTPGVYDYECSVHGNLMAGTITVQ